MKLFRAIGLSLMLGTSQCWAEVFSIAQVGDIHAGLYTADIYGTNWVPWVLAHTNDGVLNVRIVVSTGDCYEQSTAFTNQGATRYSAAMLTNDVRLLRDSGLLTFFTDGNHDADNTNNLDMAWASWPVVSGQEWNTVFPPPFFTNQNYYVTSRFAGDTKNMAMVYTNGNIKLLFVSYHSDPTTNTPNATYQPQTTWVSNIVAQYPDHNAIICAHYFLSTNSTPAYADGTGYENIGPGAAPFEQAITNLPNLMLFMSGHNRRLFKGSYLTTGKDGHPIRATVFNTQNHSELRTTDFVNLFTFDTVASTVQNRTYIISEARYMTDYERGSRMTNTTFPNGFQHTWTMPIPRRPPVTLFLRR